jgi:hypothetical protein
VKTLRLSGLLGCMLTLTLPVYAQESPLVEKMRAVSPDKKFAMRVSCSDEPADPANINSEMIDAIELVALPSKKVVAQLLPSGDVGTHFEDVTLIWSADSKWCAFYYEQPRTGYTTVFRRVGSKFVAANKPEKLMIHLKDIKSEYVRPVRWLQPGVLALKQLTIFFHDDAEANYQFTARFDAKTGKFQVTSKREVAADESTAE